MESGTLRGVWNVQKAKLKLRYTWLTDNDLIFVEGNEEEMLRRIQIKLGKTKQQLQDIIAAL